MGQVKLFGLGLLAAIIAAVYQLELPRAIVHFAGIGHTFEPLKNFPYKCQRIDHPRLQACEDMWLSESTRQLFLACSDMGNFNVTARSLKESIVVLDIDEPATSDGTFPLRVMDTPDYAGVPGDEGRLYPLSLSGSDEPGGTVRLWVINAAPSADHATGALLDQAAVGGNLTVEVFVTKGPKSTELKHMHTFAHKHIATPNRVAPRGDGTNDFWYTNDHGHSKVGLGHALSGPLGWGDVSYCTTTTTSQTNCHTVATGHKFPNGLAYNSHDGLLYVPSSLLGRVYVYKPEPPNRAKGDLELIATLDAGMSLDNIIVDKTGDMYIAAFPRATELLAAYTDPYGSFPATAAIRIRKNEKVEGGYEVAKVIEDGKGGKAEVLPGATSVLHDVKTGRLFFSSVISPFIGVCEKI
ncbi:hypothetical protein Micbo1qcDRAFT_207011 [Microdochium bolleyi]|uniref:SMP-30/Gluconolactonase/LRE-like region domain-containing protein n=1 Tax=Microdochium bolleyi TaxID=196109 RepID=A0A136IVH7_9PEZI|nr:hypothetical protein Micbo1qcDRAFT_207011 [Microdochium bolleyi]